VLTPLHALPSSLQMAPSLVADHAVAVRIGLQDWHRLAGLTEPEATQVFAMKQ
jgi:hypothetical protein